MEALKFLAFMLSIAPICSRSEENPFQEVFHEVCADPSSCPAQSSPVSPVDATEDILIEKMDPVEATEDVLIEQMDLMEATEDILIEQMDGILDSVGGESSKDGVTAAENVKHQNTEHQDNFGWWVKLESEWKDLFPYSWDEIEKGLPEWMDETKMQLTDWIAATKDWTEDQLEAVVDWINSQEIQLQGSSSSSGGDKMTIVGVVASTLVLLHLINLWMVRSGRETALIARIAEMDRKLFNAKNEALITKREAAGDGVKQAEFEEIVKEKDLRIEESRQALEKALADCEKIKDECGQAAQAWKERCEELTEQVEECKKEKLEADENVKQSEEMMEEMLQYTKEKNKDGQKELLELVEKLEEQLKGQNNLLAKYEPMLKEKEKAIRELGKESKQLKVDEANARLEVDKVRKELCEVRAKAETASKTETDWKSLADLLQSQIEEKMVAEERLVTEVGDLKSRLGTVKSEAEEKEEQLEELKELVLVLESKKEEERMDSGDGWDLDDECDVEDAKEVAKLRVQVRKMEELKLKMEREMAETKTEWGTKEKELKDAKEEKWLIQSAKEAALKEKDDAVRKLDVLTEFFNRKETELQKEIGIQGAKFDNLSTDAETANKKLVATMTELEVTQATLQIVKRELEEQEVSLKASVASEEKKAHENWVAARQAERKLGDLQGDLGLMRNRLTTVEANNHALIQRNDQLQKIVDQFPTASDNETPSDGYRNGYTMEAAQNGLNNGAHAADSLKNRSGSMNEYTNFNSVPFLPSETFSEMKVLDQSVPIQSSLPPLPGINNFTSPPSHLPGLPTLPGLSEPTSLPPLLPSLPSLPGMMSLANTTIPMMDMMDRRTSYRDHATDGRPPSNTPRTRRKYSPENDRVSSSTFHYRAYSPPLRGSSSRMSYEGDSPPRSGRNCSSRRSSPGGGSRHGSSPGRSQDGRHSRGEQRSYREPSSPTRSYHRRDRGSLSKEAEGSAQKYERSQSERKISMGSNGKPVNGTGWGNGYEKSNGYSEDRRRDGNELTFKDQHKTMSRTRDLQNSFSGRTSSPMDHAEQFRNII